MSSLHLLHFVLTIIFASGNPIPNDDLDSVLSKSGENRAELEQAMDRIPADQREDLIWLLMHMPEVDLLNMRCEQLLRNSELAHQAFHRAPWSDQVPREIYLDCVLPYACINEKRDAWRSDFNERFSPLVQDAASTSEAAAILNNAIYSELGVVYSADRPRPDQSPQQSIEAGMASCTGLSILLIDACRSVGIPARFVGTPLWSDGSGNHSWVEIYDSGKWHFTGAAEPTGTDLDKAWFTSRASTAVEGHPSHAILAVTWRRVPLNFPLPWLTEDHVIRAVDVTQRYIARAPEVPEGRIRVRFRAIDKDGRRRAIPLEVGIQGNDERVEGITRDDRFDTNHHLEFMLPKGSIVEVLEGWPSGSRTMEYLVTGDEQLITLTSPDAKKEQSSQ